MADVLPLPNPVIDAARALFGETHDAISTHDYRDAAGTLLFVAVFGYGTRRYMRRDGETWLKCRRPALCPLYRLPQITSSSVADVWLVPDERDADRLARMGFLASRLPAKDTDIAHLADRSLVLWGGILTGRDAAGILRNATVKRLAAITSRLCVVDPATDLPNVWLGDHPNATRADIAEMTTVSLADLRKRKHLSPENGDVLPPNTPAPEVLKEISSPKIETNGEEKSAHVGNVTFALNESGLWAYETKADGGCSTVFLGARFDILAKTRSCDSGGWGRLLQWRDADGKTHTVAIPVAIAYGDGAELMRFLSSQGWRGRCGRKVTELICNYLIGWPVEARAVCTARVGWAGSAFVTPERIIGGSDQERVVYQPNAPVVHGHARKGHLDGWKHGVAELARGNSRIMLAISAAFAGPLLRRTGTPGGGLHLYGDSSSGKSNAVRAAASVWGFHRDLMRQWRATDNGLEALAEAANDGLLMLDEIKQLDSRLVGAAAYMLANGQGKARMTKGLVVRPPASWELLFLSSGEHTLQQMMQEAGQKSATGQALRIPSIPCDLGPRGLVEDLHGFHDSKSFMQAGLEPALTDHFGHAGQAWLDRVVPDIAAVSKRALELRDRFVAEAMNGSTSGQIARVATRFGLVAAAGELATSCDITGWLLGEAWRAVRTCFDAWLAFEAPTPERTKADILESVRAVLQRDIGRFPNIRCEEALDRSLDREQRDEALRIWRADLDAIARAGQLYGFRRMSLGDDGDIETEFFVNKRAFERALCDGQNPILVKARLREAGWLKAGQDGRDTRNICTPLGRQWCYVLNANALSAQI